MVIPVKDTLTGLSIGVLELVNSKPDPFSLDA